MIELRHENDTATLRADGRKLNESRQVSFELGTIKKTSGSAIFTIGNTKVAAFLQGPHQVSHRKWVSWSLIPVDYLTWSWPDPWWRTELSEGHSKRKILPNKLQCNGTQGRYQERHENEGVLSCAQVCFRAGYHAWKVSQEPDWPSSFRLISRRWL